MMVSPFHIGVVQSLSNKPLFDTNLEITQSSCGSIEVYNGIVGNVHIMVFCPLFPLKKLSLYYNTIHL